MYPDLFKHRNIYLVTRHKKEDVIIPVFSKAGINLKPLHTIDTDLFGTFTGEVERRGTQVEVARQKALHALHETGENIAIASEGSFGPHPTLYFVPANIELVLLVDTLNNIELQGWEISTDTNFSHQVVRTVEEARQFAARAGFPSHAMVVRPNAGNYPPHLLSKGITSENELVRCVEQSIQSADDEKALIETDMRAMYNPTRMKVIEKAALQLLQKMESLCPQCNWPGFWVSERKAGLPCAHCGIPTRATLSHIYTCQKCGLRKEVMFPEDKETEDAMHCDACNP